MIPLVAARCLGRGPSGTPKVRTWSFSKSQLLRATARTLPPAEVWQRPSPLRQAPSSATGRAAGNTWRQSGRAVQPAPPEQLLPSTIAVSFSSLLVVVVVEQQLAIVFDAARRFFQRIIRRLHHLGPHGPGSRQDVGVLHRRLPHQI